MSCYESLVLIYFKCIYIYCFVFSSCQADHLFTNKRAESDPERAKLLMSKHVQAAHNIYSETVFTINGKSKKGIYLISIVE